MAKKKRYVYRTSQGQPVTPEYHGIEETRLEFSDNFIVQHDPDGFYLTFLQMQHPIVLTPEDVAKIKKVRLECVGRFVVTPNGLDAIINALIENRDKFKKKFALEEEDAETEPRNIATQETLTTQGLISEKTPGVAKEE